MKTMFKRFNAWMTNYLYYPGDEKEVIIQKKIFWCIHIFGIPLILFFFFDFYNIDLPSFRELFYIFIGGMVLVLILFHFHRNHIEGWALYAQVAVVVICSVKVYFYGGMPYAGAPIFIGLLGPIYALVLPKKKRAILVLALYLIGMGLATYLHPHPNDLEKVNFFTQGLFASLIQVFIIVYYFTTQFDKLKTRERIRIEELNEAKTKLYTNITHEFRTPITMILGMTEAIEENLEGDQNNQNGRPSINTEEALTMINRNGRKLLNLTNQMLDLSKLESKTMPIHFIQDDIVVYLKYIMESFDSYARSKNISLEFNARPGTVIMDFDPDKIQDILSNLLSNAVKFTPAQGMIHVEISIDDPEYLTLKVRDTGIGVPAKQLPYVFDRYYQAEQNEVLVKEGTGLGLALTKELVLLLNGTIQVDSPAPGKFHGTEFTVTLPISRNAEQKHPLNEPKRHHIQHIAKNPNEIQDENGLKLTLMIVEDNPDVTNYLYAILGQEYNIITARNGKEGIEKSLEVIPDLIISDVMMPVMDGFKFCKNIKQNKRTSHIPIIILTARADHSSKLEGLESGADAYLAKPFNKEELLVRVRKLITLRKELQKRYRDWTKTGGTLDMENSEDRFMENVLQILKDHLDDVAFGVEQLSRELAMSRTQLYRKFRALTDVTVQEFIRDVRLNKAKELLLHSGSNVTEVAMDTGFRNLSHFSKVFSEKFGIPPSKVVKQGFIKMERKTNDL